MKLGLRLILVYASATLLSACDPGFRIVFVNHGKDTAYLTYNADSLADFLNTDTTMLKRYIFTSNEPHALSGSWVTYRVLPSEEIAYVGGIGTPGPQMRRLNQTSKFYFIHKQNSADTLFFNQAILEKRITGKRKWMSEEVFIDIGY